MRKLLILAALLLCAMRAEATYVGSASNSSTNGTDTTLTVTYSATQGNCLIIGVMTDVTPTISSVKDNNSTVYPLLVSSAVSSVTHVNGYGACGISSGITSITVTFTAGPNIYVPVAEYSSFSALGLRPAGTNSPGSSTAASISLTTQANNNTVVGLFYDNGGATTASGSGTIRQNSAYLTTNTGTLMDISSASPASVTDSVMWSTSGLYTAAAIELSTSSFNIAQFTGANCATATTCPDTFPQAVQTGNYILGMGYDGASPTLSVTYSDGVNNSGGNYTQVSIAGHLYCGIATDGDTLAMSYWKSSSSSAFTVTMADGGSSSHKTILIVEIDGLAASNPVDQVSNCTNTLAVSSLTTGSVTTTSANEIVIPFFGSVSALHTFASGTGYTLLTQIPTGASSGTSANEFQALTSTGTYNAAMTLSTGGTDEMAGFLVTFKSSSQPVANPGSTRGGPSMWGSNIDAGRSISRGE